MTHRIFVAYDLEHDRDLCDRLQESSGNQGVFVVSGGSQGGEMTESWERRTHTQIAAAEQVVIVCGEHTDECVRIATELRIAKELEKPIVLLWARREAMCKKPSGTHANDSMYSWTPDVLRDQLVANQRKAQPPVVPERLKRVVPAPKPVEGEA